jgi:hypothetical protein
MYDLICVECKENFECKRSNGKYCSHECRLAIHNRRQREKRGTPPEKIFEEIDGEIWKDIEGYEDLYKISNFGRVLSIKKLMTGSINKKLMAGSINNRGYKCVALYKDSVQKTCKLHRLIAINFIPNPDELPCIDHRDRNKLNNDISNLRWLSHRENNLNRDHVEFKKKVTTDKSNGKIYYRVYYYPDGINRTSKSFLTYEEAEEFADKMIEEGLFHVK